MKILLITDDIYEENCYVVIDENDCTLIDPGFNFDKINNLIKSNKYNLSTIILTHGHIDHLGDLDKISKEYPNACIYIHELDLNMLFDVSLNASKLFGMPKAYPKTINVKTVKDQDRINKFKVYHVPGHTKGSIVLYLDYSNGMLFTGDTLFKNSVGRTDLPTGSMIEIEKSLEKIIKSFSKSINILPGHYSKTTLKDELKNNPYLKKGWFK